MEWARRRSTQKRTEAHRSGDEASDFDLKERFWDPRSGVPQKAPTDALIPAQNKGNEKSRFLMKHMQPVSAFDFCADLHEGPGCITCLLRFPKLNEFPLRVLRDNWGEVRISCSYQPV